MARATWTRRRACCHLPAHTQHHNTTTPQHPWPPSICIAVSTRKSKTHGLWLRPGTECHACTGTAPAGKSRLPTPRHARRVWSWAWSGPLLHPGLMSASRLHDCMLPPIVVYLVIDRLCTQPHATAAGWTELIGASRTTLPCRSRHDTSIAPGSSSELSLVCLPQLQHDKRQMAPDGVCVGKSSQPGGCNAPGIHSHG